MNALLLVTLSAIGAGDSYLAWNTAPTTDAKAAPSLGTRLTEERWAELQASLPVPPYDDMNAGVESPDGSLWIGTAGGVLFLPKGAPRWRVFHSRRWLPSDVVEDLAVVAAPPDPWAVVVTTREGRVRLFQKSDSLQAKMDRILANLRKYHVRDGLITDIVLEKPGDPEAGYHQYDNDNDGLWTSMYVAAEAFRFATTGAESARKNARQSLEALMFLERITGIPGFAARSFVPISVDKSSGQHGEWHRAADGKHWWKGDTSSDELDGHYFAYAIYYDLVATPEEKKEIAAVVGRITNHIIEHGYYYVGPPGHPTTWGVWAPEKLNRDLKWIGDRGLNSLEILSHLKVAEHITGDAKYAAAARELIDKHSYDINTVDQKVVFPTEEINHSDDELAFLAYHPLVLYERDERLRPIYMTSLRRSWLIERPETSPLFNYIYAAGRQANRWTDPFRRPPEAFVRPESYDAAACRAWFEDTPEDLYDWRCVNSRRRDIGPIVKNRADEARGLTVLPPSERRVMRWNGDPYTLDGGGEGRNRDDGTYVLLPYWMGRYYRFLD